MIVVNTTFVTDKSVFSEVLTWVKKSYIPSARASMQDVEPLVCKIIDNPDPDTVNFAVHITFADIDTARRWTDGVAASLLRIMSSRWGDKALSFTTLLETI